MKPFKKLKMYAQSKAGLGWNRHVGGWHRRYANRVIRRWFKKEDYAQF